MNALLATTKTLPGLPQQQEPTRIVARAMTLDTADNPGRQRRRRQGVAQAGTSVFEATDACETLVSFRQQALERALLAAVLPVIDGFTCCRQGRAACLPFRLPAGSVATWKDKRSVLAALASEGSPHVTPPRTRTLLRRRVPRLRQQVRLVQQVQGMNQALETYAQTLNVTLQERTTQLQRALEFESTLKHITDRVRDSLDESTILQTVVRELAWALELGCCNAAIYDCEARLSHVWYEYTASIPGYQHQTLQMDHYPEIYDQLLQGEAVEFCSLTAQDWRGQVALFAFPVHNGEPMGDIWLVSHAERLLNDLELRLVQQVINQCVIAMRQARLYQAAQAQVQSLAHLNQLKDDFLSTVSHELRTPVTNIRLAVQLLERCTERNLELSQGLPELSANLTKDRAYVQILHSECDREINLINDLLDLQRLEVGQQESHPVTLPLPAWLPPLMAAFDVRAQTRQQTLHLQMADALPALTIDPSCLQRILTELMHNACKYAPTGANITLSVTKTADATPSLDISVTNTGVTIPAQALERIFDKFYRVAGSDRWQQGGTGLGLALVKQLVAHCAGVIRVTSGFNQTCFLVSLPLGARGQP